MGRYGTPLSLGFAAVICALFAFAPQGARAADIILGVGAKADVQYDVGRAVCRQVQRSAKGTTCEALRIEGGDAAEPLAVLSAVRTGAIEIGLVKNLKLISRPSNSTSRAWRASFRSYWRRLNLGRFRSQRRAFDRRYSKASRSVVVRIAVTQMEAESRIAMSLVDPSRTFVGSAVVSI